MTKKKTGSTAIYMTYGNYLKDYPNGRKDNDVKPKDFGYCIIDNQDKKNICWLKESTFHLINNGLAAVREMDEDPTGKKTRAKERKLKKLLEKQRKLREKQEERERKERAYIVQARDEFSDLMLNATAAQWAAILRLVKTVEKDADTIWLMTNEWKKKQKEKSI